jgi:hypothetical protein
VGLALLTKRSDDEAPGDDAGDAARAPDGKAEATA